ncbi:MAG TPA: hypothetical protein PJ997_02305 [Candidatus Paceibacterota bacterium]|nr:hypothetical protein [Candidatus Paceibacterota bacterium]HMP19146.1 hypothetical protein [Candidatus Paceibacterota bacterium]HMP85145.1 hypothetical protein [Candidatus Paceibacterota bacterium]
MFFLSDLKYKLKNILQSNFFIFFYFFIVSSSILYIANSAILDIYWNNIFVSGWDGSGHYAIGKYYAENIFPAVWGWIPNWYSGMPFPQFYPPLFYYIVALLYKITNIDYATIFKFVAIFSVFIIPTLLSFSYYKLIKKSFAESFFVLLISVLILSVKSRFEFISVSIASITNNGLVTQPLAVIFLILWLISIFQVEKKESAKYYSILFLTFLMLSNAHVAIVALIIFTILFILKFKNNFFINKQYLKTLLIALKHCFYVLVPLLISSFWYIPMIKYYDYFVGMSLGFTQGSLGNLLYYHYYILIILIISVIFNLKIKNIFISIINIFLSFCLISIYLKLNYKFQSLPFHLDRWLGTIYLFIPILIVFCFSEIKKYLNKKLYIILIIIISSISFYHINIMNGFRDSQDGIYVNNEQDDLTKVIQYFKDKEGLILIEHFAPSNIPIDKVLHAYLGSQGNTTVYSIIRESSLSSLVWVPVGNGLSEKAQCWGTRCRLAYDKEFLNKPINHHIINASNSGVEYFLIRTKKIRDQMDKSPLVEKITEVENWSIYQTKPQLKNVLSKIEKTPILIFSELNTRKWSKTPFDFIYLIEELNIKRLVLDFIFVYNKDQKIDNNKYIEKFDYVLFDTYKYQDIDTALNTIKNYLSDDNNRKIFALKSDDPIFEKIAKLSSEYKDENNKSRIILIENIPNKYPDSHYDYLIELLRKNIPNQKSNQNFKIIKQSYFPAWKDVYNSDIFLASPTHMFTFNKKANIYFETPKIVLLSHYISIMTLIGLLLVVVKRYIKSK